MTKRWINPGLIAAAALLVTRGAYADMSLLNVSYDATRELYQQIDKGFATAWQKQGGQAITIDQSHGGSGGQARAVIDGQEADVVTLALSSDIDAIAKVGLLAPDWAGRLPGNSVPYTSTIVFLVHKGNPKHIADWPDLIKPGVQVITPNPKISGGARWAYLAAWGHAAGANKDQTAAKAYVTALYKNVPVMDSGARAATTTFAQRGIGDVLLSWENEAYQALDQLGADQFEIVVPPDSIRAEPPVAVVDKNVDKHKTRAAAEAYLKYLYTPEAQAIEAKNHLRPTDQTVAAQVAAQFKPVKLSSIGDFGGWATVQKTHFDDGGIFDQITAGK